MIKTYTEKTPAKINIGLRLISKLENGYHEIETIFYPVGIFDEVTLNIRKLTGSENHLTGISVKFNPDLKLKRKDNICLKAVELFFERFRINEPYDIKIKIRKKIPIGAGLGGGSSDAACVLNILAKHFKVELIHKYHLNLIAAELGSDVPFFLTGKPAFGDNRGDRLTHLPDFEIRRKILIVNPGIKISTKWAYTQFQRQKNKRWNKKMLRFIKTYALRRAGLMKNRLEPFVFKKHPSIGKIKENMYKFGAEFSLMSGSGSSVYGLFKEQADLRSALKYFKSKRYQTFIS